jgi:hypothetical protein
VARRNLGPVLLYERRPDGLFQTFQVTKWFWRDPATQAGKRPVTMMHSALASRMRKPISSILVSMVLLRTRLTMLFLFLEVCSVATAQVEHSNVLSARLENIAMVPDKASIHVNIRNAGARTNTAFSIAFYQLNPNRERTPCGGRGADMIDWSDPMPGRSIYIHMRRNWVPPNGTNWLST